jgi:hypothetical protein
MSSTGEEIRKSLRIIAFAVIAMYVLLLLVTIPQHAALCSFKGDLERRIATNEHFLSLSDEEREVEYGAAFGDIPDDTIRQSVANQRATLDSLGLLICIP